MLFYNGKKSIDGAAMSYSDIAKATNHNISAVLTQSEYFFAEATMPCSH